jgi:hypothetical protein
MADSRNSEENKAGDQTSAPAKVPHKAVREVVVAHLDEPPPSGKQKIHPRRPAPIVPTREERTGERSDQDTRTEDADSE